MQSSHVACHPFVSAWAQQLVVRVDGHPFMPPLNISPVFPDVEIRAASAPPSGGKPLNLPFTVKSDLLWLGQHSNAHYVDLKKPKLPYELWQAWNTWNRRLGFLLRAFDPNDEKSKMRNGQWQYDVLQEAIRKQQQSHTEHPVILASGFINLEWLTKS